MSNNVMAKREALNIDLQVTLVATVFRHCIY